MAKGNSGTPKKQRRGRPRAGEGRDVETPLLSLRVPKEAFQEIQDRADAANVSRSEMAKELLLKALRMKGGKGESK